MTRVVRMLSILIIAAILIGASGCLKPYAASGRVEDAGAIGIEGVLITFTGGFSGTTVTDLDGNWSMAGLKGVVTVTPSKIGWSFIPVNRTISGEFVDVDFVIGPAIVEKIAAGYYHSVGMYGDGTVKAVGYDDWGQIDVDEWASITNIAAGYYHSMGLELGGTVIIASTSPGNPGGVMLKNGRTSPKSQPDASSVLAYKRTDLSSQPVIIPMGNVMLTSQPGRAA